MQWFQALKRASPRVWWLAPYAFLAAAVLAAYANIYGNQFLYDDEFLIVYNMYLRDWSLIGAIFSHTVFAGAQTFSVLYRPLQNLLYLIVYQLGDTSPTGFHILNVGLHAIDTCLLYALGRKLGFKPMAVFLAALIWGLHPVQTTAIAYISGTADPLCVFFCLGGLLVLLPAFTPRRVAVGALFFILALLSKETAVVFPALAVICLFAVSNRRTDPKIYLRTWPLWLIAVLYGTAHSLALGTEVFDPARSANDLMYLYATHFLYRFYTFLAALPTYLRILVWPTGLHVEHVPLVYDVPWNLNVAAGALMLVAALGQIIWGKARRGLALSWGLLWWAIAYSPQSGLVFPMHTMLRENWMYLPSAGLWLGVAQTLADLCAQRSQRLCRAFLAAAGMLIAVIFGIMTYQQNKNWENDFTYYPQVLKYNPAPLMFNNLANAYIRQGMDDPSRRQEAFAKAGDLLRQSLALGDTLPQTHMNMAYIMLLTPGWQAHAQDVIAQLKRALEIDPDFLAASEQLVSVYQTIGDTRQAAIYQARTQDIRARHRVTQ